MPENTTCIFAKSQSEKKKCSNGNPQKYYRPSEAVKVNSVQHESQKVEYIHMHVQWRSQPDFWSCKFKSLCYSFLQKLIPYTVYKQWLRHCACAYHIHQMCCEKFCCCPIPLDHSKFLLKCPKIIYEVFEEEGKTLTNLGQ